ncbi:MAG: hypothetical protein R3C12_13375 [Planctomycetaceae bacterium]|nr:hypothetical protein [Planctomycetaceae bacterium]
MYIPDADGRLKPVPINVTLREYLEWLEQREKGVEGEQAAWTIRLLEARGEIKTAANGNSWEQIHCQMTIAVGESPRWNSVPLMLGEGLLAGMTDSEEGIASHPLMLTRDIDSGQWLLWYRNRSTFTIKLEMLVPLRAMGDQTQLLLTFPSALRTEFALAFARSDLQVELASRGFWEKQELDGGMLVRIAGFQQAIDLRWSPERADAEIPPLMHVDTQIELLRGSESSHLTARQKITVDRGNVNILKVRLPAGFQVDGVSAELPMRYAIDGSDPSAITLSFSQAIQSSVQIDWKLSSPIRRFESLIFLDGFSVEGARTQTGRIGILKSSEWRMGQIPARSENVYRMNVRDFPVMGEYSQAYRYYSQPYRLGLNTQRMEPEFSHASYHQLHVEADLLRLYVDFEITPSNSVLDTIRLDWPELNAGVWIPERIVRESTGEPIPWQIEGDDKLLLTVPGLFEREVIRLEASRKLPRVPDVLVDQHDLQLSLPHISTSEARSRHRVLRLSSPLILPWEPRLHSEQIELLATRHVPNEWQERKLYQQRQGMEPRHQWYRLSPGGEPMRLSFESIERKMEAMRTVELEQIDARNRRLAYVQRFRFTISRLPLETLRLVQRQPLQEKRPELEMRFTDSQGNELVPVVTRIAPEPGKAAPSNPEAGESTEVEYQLEFTPRSPVLGEYQLNVYRSLATPPPDRAETVTVSLPLLEVPDVPDLPGKFRNRSAYQVDPGESGWQLSEVVQGIPLWLHDNTSNVLPLKVSIRQPRIPDNAGPVQGEIQSWLSGDGQLITEMAFRIARTPPAFVLRDMDGFELISAYWKAEGHAQPILLETYFESAETTLLFPAAAIGVTGKLVVTVKQRSGGSLLSLWHQELKLPEHTLSSDLTLLHWNLNLPRGMYLFNTPQHQIPCYRWGWQGLGFRRIPLETAQTNGRTYSGAHPSYCFSSVGWPRQMEVQLIGRGLMMTLGTGLPILIVVLLAGRSRELQLRGGLLLLLGVGTLAVMYPEPFLVLVQPALLGLLFITIATWLSWKVRQHREEPTLIIVGPGGHAESPGGQGVSFSDHGVGADDITRIQAPPRQILESSRS